MKRLAQDFLILLLLLSVLTAFTACGGDEADTGANDESADDGNTDDGNTDDGNTDGENTEDENKDPYSSTFGDNVIDFDTIA